MEEAKKSTRTDAYYLIANGSRPVINNNDGTIRWLEDNQEIQFINPSFIGKNAEFSILNMPNQKIWFSQLSQRGIGENFSTPLLDEIILKGQPKSFICEKYKNPVEFWDAVRGKRFRVTVLGSGFCVNRNSPLVKELLKPIVTGRHITEKNDDNCIFDYVRTCVSKGHVNAVTGTIKNKKAYRLTEI